VKIASLACALSVAGCDFFAPNSPDVPLAIELPFCAEASTPLTWAAVKRERGDWVFLEAADGIARFTASGRLTVAYGNEESSRVFAATARELNEVRCFPKWTVTKVLEGRVGDVPAGENYTVSVGPVSFTQSPFAAFIGDGPQNVVAWTASASTGEPRKVILRQGINLPSGSEIPILYFSGNEARDFEFADATIIGGSNAYAINFLRPWGNSHGLRGAEVSSAPWRYYAAPEELLAPEDYHTIEILSFSQNAPQQLTYYYRRARNVTLTIGPDVSTPSSAIVETTPCARISISVPGQAEYSSFVIVHLATFGMTGNMQVGVTREFLGGTPSTWQLETPDLRRPDGTCLLPPDPFGYTLFVTPQQGRIGLYLGGPGRDGEVRRWSGYHWSSP
jgi:hypothetical protein